MGLARSLLDGREKRLAFDAIADLWGGRVVAAKEDLNEKQPVAPIDLTKDLNCPLLGLFGNDDQGPSPDQVNTHEEALKEAAMAVTGKPIHI